MAHSLETLRVYNKKESLIDNLESNMMPGLRLAYLTLAQQCEENPDNQHLDTVRAALRSCIAVFETIADAYEEGQEKKPATAPEDAPR